MPCGVSMKPGFHGGLGASLEKMRSTWGESQIDATGVTTALTKFSVGDFDDGDVKTWSPVKSFGSSTLPKGLSGREVTSSSSPLPRSTWEGSLTS